MDYYGDDAASHKCNEVDILSLDETLDAISAPLYHSLIEEDKNDDADTPEEVEEEMFITVYAPFETFIHNNKHPSQYRTSLFLPNIAPAPRQVPNIPVVEKNVEADEKELWCFYPEVKVASGNSEQTDSSCSSPQTRRLWMWDSEEPRAADIIPNPVRCLSPITEPVEVTCSDFSGTFYPKMLCRGARGPCIEVDGEWVTPNEFERMAGRGKSRYWKRSLLIKGFNILSLIESGKLTEHSRHCLCIPP